MPSHLENLAKRMESDPFFLAFALAEYVRGRDVDDNALASELGCDLETLTELRLCRMPEPDQFREGINQMVGRFGVTRDVLMNIVRLGQNLVKIRASSLQDASFMMAARDREPTGDDS